MRVRGLFKKHGLCGVRMTLLLMALLLLFGAGVAFGSGGEGHGQTASKRWDYKLSTGERDWTDTFRVMNFAVLAIGLFLVLKKPVSQALGGRIQGIKDQLEELEAKKKGAEDELAEYGKKFAALDKEAENLMAEYIKQGEEAKERILKEAESAAEKLKEQASRNIEQEFKQAKEKLQVEIAEKALVKAEAMIKEKITADDHEKLVDEYLEKVVA